MISIEEIVVVGAGNWGLALAGLLAKAHPVRVWAIDRAAADHLNAHRGDSRGSFRHPIPDAVRIEPKYAGPLDEKRTLIVFAVPSSQVRPAAEELAERAEAPLILSVSKGFDMDWQCTMSEVIRRVIPKATVVVLTGPTIANEVAEGKPTRAVLACEDLPALAQVKRALRNDVLSFEVSRHPHDHEICAALKGIVAIGVGMADGLGMGTNLQGVLMTQGIREMGVVASFFGVPNETAFGLSGAADLITTCISPDSRNRRLGALLAQGLTVEEALSKVGMTVEGVAMSRTIETLWALDVSIPLFHMVNATVLGECADVRKVLTALIATL